MIDRASSYDPAVAALRPVAVVENPCSTEVRSSGMQGFSTTAVLQRAARLRNAD